MKYAVIRHIVISLLFIGILINPACKTVTPGPDEEKAAAPKPEKAPFEALAIDDTGNRYAMGFGNGIIELFEFDSGRLLKTFIINEKYLKYGKYNHILYLDFSPDGNLLASGTEDGFVRIWDVKTGRLIHELAHPYKEEYQKGVFSLAFSPNSGLLASAGAEYVVIWQTETGKLFRTLDAGTEHVVDFSPDGKMLLTAHWDKMTLWDTANWQVREIIASSGRKYRDIACARFDQTGKTLIYVCDDKIFFYDINNRILKQEYNLPDAIKSKYYPYSIFYTSGGEHFLGYLDPWDGVVKIFDLDKHKPVFNLQHMTGDILVITSADGWVEIKPESASELIYSDNTDDRSKNYRQGLFTAICGLRTRHNFPGYGGAP
jgi:WD40 repeat protein